jgi:chromosome condensin MukBEF ATPase and DNA-binding subunit MukB
MRKIKFTRPSSVDEHVNMGQKLVDELNNLWELQEEKKDSAKAYGEQVKAKEAYIKVLQMNLQEHKVDVEFECKVRKNFRDGEWQFVDPTTGEIVYTEAFTEADWLWPDDRDADEVMDKHGSLRAPTLAEGPKVLQLTAGDSQSSAEEWTPKK